MEDVTVSVILSEISVFTVFDTSKRFDLCRHRSPVWIYVKVADNKLNFVKMVLWCQVKQTYGKIHGAADVIG